MTEPRAQLRCRTRAGTRFGGVREAAARVSRARARHHRPGCGVTVQPGRGAPPPPDEHGHGGADDPGQEGVGQGPEPGEEVEPVEGHVHGRVLARECAAPLPTAPRYGKGLESRPIFTRTVCHSRTHFRPHLPSTRAVRAAAAGRRPFRGKNGAGISPRGHFFSTRTRAQPSWVGTHNAPRRREAWGALRHRSGNKPGKSWENIV